MPRNQPKAESDLTKNHMLMCVRRIESTTITRLTSKRLGELGDIIKNRLGISVCSGTGKKCSKNIKVVVTDGVLAELTSARLVKPKIYVDKYANENDYTFDHCTKKRAPNKRKSESKPKPKAKRHKPTPSDDVCSVTDDAEWVTSTTYKVVESILNSWMGSL